MANPLYLSGFVQRGFTMD